MKIAYYTCITGGKDSYIEPRHYDDGVDYYILTDRELGKYDNVKHINISRHNNGFEYMDILTSSGKLKKNRDRNNAVNHLISQKYRILPFMHESLEEYDVTLWHDGSMILKDTLLDYIDRVLGSNSIVGLVRHPQRDCVYDELLFREHIRKGFPQINDRAYNKYKSERFPENYGLWAGGMHIFVHNKRLNRYYEYLWGIIVNDTFSDQIGFPYWLWKYGIPFVDFGRQNDKANTGKIIIRGHNWRQIYES